MNFKDRALKLFLEHQKPTVKFEIVKTKLFFTENNEKVNEKVEINENRDVKESREVVKSRNDEESRAGCDFKAGFEVEARCVVKEGCEVVKKGENVEEHEDDRTIDEVKTRRQALSRILDIPRVEKRSARTKLNYISERNLVEVIKIHGTNNKIQSMGFKDDKRHYIYGEEALYLIETNRAELFLNGRSVSLESAYSMLLKNLDDMVKYKTYRKLLLGGSEVMKVAQNKFLDENPAKRIKLDPDTNKTNINQIFEETNINANKFDKLKGQAPKLDDKFIDKPPDYVVSNATTQTSSESYNLHFLFSDELDPKIGFYRNGNNKNVYCVPGDDITLVSFESFQINTNY